MQFTSKCEHTIYSNPTYFRFEFSHWRLVFSNDWGIKKTIEFTGEFGRVVSNHADLRWKDEAEKWKHPGHKLSIGRRIDLPQRYKHIWYSDGSFIQEFLGFFWGVKRFSILSSYLWEWKIIQKIELFRSKMGETRSWNHSPLMSLMKTVTFFKQSLKWWKKQHHLRAVPSS